MRIILIHSYFRIDELQTKITGQASSDELKTLVTKTLTDNSKAAMDEGKIQSLEDEKRELGRQVQQLKDQVSERQTHQSIDAMLKDFTEKNDATAIDRAAMKELEEKNKELVADAKKDAVDKAKMNQLEKENKRLKGVQEQAIKDGEKMDGLVKEVERLETEFNQTTEQSLHGMGSLLAS